MTDKTDLWTKILDRTIDIIFVKYPTRTSLGIALGGFFDFLIQLFAPTLRAIEFIELTNSPRWGWWLLGTLVMHAPTIISSFRQELIGDDKIDQALELIERGNFTKAEKRKQYQYLIEQVASNVALKPELKKELKETEKKITADGKN
ncbi:MAG: hypothetical protein WBM35_01110 [Candidatus Electrothrix sp.]